MIHKDKHLAEDTAHEILELAARYYTEQTNKEQTKGYTIDELVDAGTEAEIPDEYIQKAIAQIGARNRQQRQRKQNKPALKHGLIAISAISLIIGAALIFRDNLPDVKTQASSFLTTNKVNDATPNTKVKITALGDTFSGYSTLRNMKFKNALQKQNIELA